MEMVRLMLAEVVSIASVLVCYCTRKIPLSFSTCPAAPNRKHWKGKTRFNNWWLPISTKKIKYRWPAACFAGKERDLVVNASDTDCDLYVWSLPNSQYQQEEDDPWNSTINDPLIFQVDTTLLSILFVTVLTTVVLSLAVVTALSINCGFWIPVVKTRYTQTRQEHTQPQSAQEKTYLIFWAWLILLWCCLNAEHFV